MALRQADKREFFHWMLNCLQEKLQEEVRIDSRPVQLHNAGKIYQERPEPTVRDGLQDNTTNLPTASLGGQERQNDPPNVQTETNEEREDEPIDSDSETRESEHSEEEDNHEHPPKDQDVEGPHRKKWKLSDQSTTEVSGTEVILFLSFYKSTLHSKTNGV